MNRRQLQKLGVPEACINEAIAAIPVLLNRSVQGKEVKNRIEAVVRAPHAYTSDPILGPLATAILEDQQLEPAKALEYPTWGASGIDQAAHEQMRQASRVPVAVAGALMPDAHVGYGLPIGGVLACENAVIPYAVGVDIACRMKLSVLDLPIETFEHRPGLFDEALEKGTRFGVGSHYQRPMWHEVLDKDWNVSRITREKKDLARQQLGTSGSGNHFVEFGLLTLGHDQPDLGLQAGRYVALLSHSGSRGPGAAVCSVYSGIARSQLPRKYNDLSRLAWLDLDSEAGQEYWEAMNLMGEFAAANHDVIHRQVSRLAGAQILAGVENHHNFAWKETHGGKQVIVHRKGATPAGAGALGVIPGSMGDPAFVVRGKGNAASLDSASHGAGRCMSRTQAKNTFRLGAVKKELAAKGVRVLSAGADEVPGVYKDIRQVMAEQRDLVEVVAQFDPRVVKMCGDGSKAED